jgi:ribosomal peptide maturation radical SAM protein 1
MPIMSYRVLLLNMPFAGADRPAIGISTLKAGLTARGIGCDIRYFNLSFAQMVGPSAYHWFIDTGSHMIFAGEWLFAQELFGDALPRASAYFRHLRSARGVTPKTIDAIRLLRTFVRPFLDECMRTIDWEQYDLIGFTSTFEQNLPSLALAHEIKQRYPNKAIVMGGANCEGSMGLALHEHFAVLDYVFTGASDETFPEFVERLRDQRKFDDLPGIAYRDGTISRNTGPAHGVADLDTLPVPDYDDYFAQLQGTDISSELLVRLQIETSRGCWWGMKQHCTFCGMNAATMRFRSKSPRRVLDEIVYLVERHNVRGIDAVDAIMDMAYFRELWPELRDRRMGLEIFYELKANLTKQQVKLLSDAGIKFVQPGIESFHTRILQSMKKGATALQNLQLLKWCKQFRVTPIWNLLYGFPDETAGDYAEQVQLIRSLGHLPPPRGCGKLRMDRFSPHFEHRNDFGFVKVRALGAYRYVYPLPPAALFEIAYFFDYQRADRQRPESYIGPTERALAAWRRSYDGGARLEFEAMEDNAIALLDTRRVKAGKRITLTSWRKAAYEHCDQARPANAIDKFVRQRYPAVTTAEVAEFLKEMVRLRLMAADKDWYLSLAVGQPLAEEHEISVMFPILEQAQPAPTVL